MFKILKPFILLGLWFTSLTGCKLGAVKKTIHFELLSDSLYVGQNNYKTKNWIFISNFSSFLKNPKNRIFTGCSKKNHFFVIFVVKFFTTFK